MTTTSSTASGKGKILQVIGPVVDVEFPPGKLPKILNALTVTNPSISGEKDNLVLEVSNDGVSGRPRTTGMGLKLAALEALQAGGIVEFGERMEGVWRVRMAVPV